jgi:hypothetical protein
MRLSILLLPSQVYLNFLEVQELSGVLEGHRQFLLELLSVLLKLFDMAAFQLTHGVSILLFDFLESFIPVLVEFLVLHDVALLYFFPLSSLVVEEFFPPSLEVLLFEFFNSVLSHFSLYKKKYSN